MKTVESKNATATIMRETKPFFSKESDRHFFGSPQNEKPFFPGSGRSVSSIQTKLNIGQPNDFYEAEADTVADKVVQRPAEPAAVRTRLFSPVSLMPFFHQISTSSEEEKKGQKQEEEEDSSQDVKKLQRKPIFESNSEPPDEGIQRKYEESISDGGLQKKEGESESQTEGSDIESSLSMSKGSGHPLPDNTRQQMESTMGADFSDVRIHDDSNAAQMSKDLNAQAFTHGSDIYFNTGKYDPYSPKGQHLLAHELTHTIQQGASDHIAESDRISESENVVSPKLVSTDNSIHRSTAGLVADVAVAERYTRNARPGIASKREKVQNEELQGKEKKEEERLSPDKEEIKNPASGNSNPGQQPEKEQLLNVHRKPEPGIQRLFGWVSDIVEWVGDKLEEGKKWLLGKVKDLIMNVRGYKALRVVLGSDPITGERVEQTGVNFIDAALDIMPFGSLITQKLEELGILNQAGTFVEKAFGRVRSLINGITGIFSNFMNSLSLSDLKDIPAVFRRLEKAFTSFFNEVINFAKGLADDFLEFIKKALLIPLGTYIKTKTKFWDLLCLIIGKDPLTDEIKQRTGANILNAILNLSDEGVEQGKKMKETGTFNKVAAWIDKGIAVFANAYELLKAAFRGLWNIVSIQALMHPVDTFLKIFDSFRKPVELVGMFFIEAGIAILKIVKEVLFKWISTKAKESRGFYLITVLIAKDPFTGESVPRTTENIVKGFMMLSEGGEEQFNKMKESGAMDRATAKIDAALETLGFTWNYVKGLFISLWNSFGWKDLLVPVLAFVKIIDTFKNPVLRLIRFVITVIVALFEVILRMMGFPVDLVFKLIENIKKAWASIKANPTGFLINLLKAIKQGFIQFFDNILTHLWNGLKAWLKQELQDAGVPMPADYTVIGIIKWLLLVLDITMEKIWTKLEKRIGKEKVDKIKKLIAKAEAIYEKANEALEFIEDVRKRGMDAIVDKIKEKLSNIWDMVLDAIKGFIMDQIIKKVTAKLLSMLDPTGIMAIINSAIALYKAIQSFIKYLARILEIVNSFVEGIIEICAGNIVVAANFLEKSLANGIPIVIGFLANQVGLDLSGRIRDVLATVREKVDKGLDFLIDKLVGFVENIIAKVKQGIAAAKEWWKEKGIFHDDENKEHEVFFEGEEENAVLTVKSEPQPYSKFLENFENSLDVNTKKAKENDLTLAKAKAKEIEDAKKEKITETDEAAKKKKQEDKDNKIKKLIEKLAELSEPLFGKSKPKDWMKTMTGGGSNLFASQMTAERIYNNPKLVGEGSEPTSAKHEIYDTLDARQKGKGSYYIRGHLLNHNLGGPGTWENMTALSRSGNSEHESKVESLVKAAFDSGAVIHYSVKSKGKQSPKEPAEGDKPKFTRIPDIIKHFDTVKKIIESEKNVVKELECEAHTMKKSGDNWEKDKEIVKKDVPNEVETDYSSYELGDSVPLPVVYLSKDEKNKEKLFEIIDYTESHRQAFINRIWTVIDDKKDKEGSSFGSYESLANYQILDEAGKVKEKFTDDQKTYITGSLKENPNVKLP